MKKKVITREKFKAIIEKIKKVDKFNSMFNDFLHKNGGQGYICMPNAVDTTIDLLHFIFGEADEGDMILYFCYELDFGKKWKAGEITDEYGNDIRLSTTDELYDYLTVGYYTPSDTEYVI